MLTLVAAVLAADGGALEIDRGLTQGLRPGDRGTVFYRLKVGSEDRRIDVGRVEVLSVSADAAVTSAPELGRVRAGFQVEFELAAERFSPGSVVAAAHEHLGEAAAAELARWYLEELRPLAEAPEGPSGPAGSVAGLAEPPALEAPADSPGPATEPAESPTEMPEPTVEVVAAPAAMLKISAGAYAIGLDAKDAEFYNETPRFENRLAAFEIDPAPTGITGLDFPAARAHCLALGKRLPTEFEWEVAARHPQFEHGSGLEWTSSRYLPYPGNRHPEDEYGERFRVLRGAPEGVVFRPQRRLYFAPSSTSEKVGFRCAVGPSESD